MNLFKIFSTKPDGEKFAQMMIEAIHENGIQRTVIYEPEGFKLKIGENDYLYLNNAYTDYLNAKESQRKDVIQTYIKAVLSMETDIPKSLDDVVSDILPTVHSRSFFELSKLKLDKQSELETPYQVISKHLAVGLCYDTPNSVMYLNQSHLNEWRISFDDLLNKAKDNLWKKTCNQFDSLMPGVYISKYQDIYDASRLLFWERINYLDVQGKPVAAVPDRNTLIVTGSDDENGLLYMSSICEKALEKTRLICTIPIVLENGAWAGLHLDETHPAYQKFRNCEVKETMIDYHEQKEILESKYQKANEEIYVASFIATQSKKGEITSYCAWVKEIPSVIPKTDIILFMENGKEILGKARWDDACSAFGDLMKLEIEYPPRYRVEPFSSLKQVNLLESME